jgi:hypothetical protein
MKKLLVIMALLASWTGSLTAYDDDIGVDVNVSDRAYFNQLQRAILANDEKWVSKELCSYPFSIFLPAGTVEIKDEKDFKKQFNRIFNSEMKKVLRDQSPNSLFKNWQGLMIGNGEIWFGEIGVTNKNKMQLEYKILAINLDALKLQAQ